MGQRCPPPRGLYNISGYSRLSIQVKYIQKGFVWEYVNGRLG